MGVGRNTSISCWYRGEIPVGRSGYNNDLLNSFWRRGAWRTRQFWCSSVRLTGEVRARAKLFKLMEERLRAAAREAPLPTTPPNKY